MIVAVGVALAVGVEDAVVVAFGATLTIGVEVAASVGVAETFVDGVTGVGTLGVAATLAVVALGVGVALASAFGAEVLLDEVELATTLLDAGVVLGAVATGVAAVVEAGAGVEETTGAGVTAAI